MSTKKIKKGVVQTFLNGREKPGIKSAIALTAPIKPGTEVDILDETAASDGSKWLKIEHAGKTVFVNKDYVKVK